MPSRAEPSRAKPSRAAAERDGRTDPLWAQISRAAPDQVRRTPKKPQKWSNVPPCGQLTNPQNVRTLKWPEVSENSSDFDDPVLEIIALTFCVVLATLRIRFFQRGAWGGGGRGVGLGVSGVGDLELELKLE